jgi:hypothetical protein
MPEELPIQETDECGKGVPIEFIEHVQHEERMYSRLRPLQGVHVPVVLGGISRSGSIWVIIASVLPAYPINMKCTISAMPS